MHVLSQGERHKLGETKKKQAFDLTNPWETWDTLGHERLKWISGSQSQASGYELVNGVSKFRILYDILLDLIWLIRSLLRLVVRKIA
jgi:hypothetical protein